LPVAQRQAIELAMPNLATVIRGRHDRLKELYAAWKDKQPKAKPVTAPPSVGRNDPCPCGSGLKIQEMLQRKERIALIADQPPPRTQA
jgi:uncharacterized protein YecA (UPF0149 family)